EGLPAPAYCRSHQEREITHCQRLGMSAIPPIGIQEADCSMFASGRRGLTQIRKGVVMPADQSHPRRGARTNVKRDFGAREAVGFAVEWMTLLISPVK